MDLRAAINEFVTQGKALCHRMRSPERTVITEVDLTVRSKKKQKPDLLDASDSAGTKPVPKRPDTP
jgi:hypothetical protein